MLQVTIKDIKTNEVIFDDEVSVVAMQAVGRENITRLRHKAEGASELDIFPCHKALMAEASEVKNLYSEAVQRALDKCVIGERE